MQGNDLHSPLYCMWLTSNRVSSASRSGNTELGDTAGSIDSSRASLIVDQSHVSDYARNGEYESDSLP